MLKKTKYEWDLDYLLGNKNFDYLFNTWVKIQNNVLKLYPNFFKSFNNFKQWMKINDELEIIENRLSNYVSNNLNIDLVDTKWLGLSQKINMIDNKISSQMSDYANIVIKNKKIIKTYLKDKNLKKYQKEFDHIFRTEPHILQPNVEKALSKISLANHGIAHVFSTLTDSDLKFQPAKDKNGKLNQIITISDVIKYLKSNDRVLRKNVWINFNSAYDSIANTLTQTLYYTYLKYNSIAKLRNFKDYVNASAFADEINEPFIMNLYKNVESFKSIYSSYKTKVEKLLLKQLKVDKLEPWDKSMDLASKPIKVTIEQTKKIVLDALSPLGKDYLSHIKTAFNEGWISWLPKKNKLTGAYSIGGIKGLNKFYILMNFDGTMGSVETITHELGHSMNSYYSTKSQEVYVDTCIFYAEIASITTETLLILYLLNKYKNDRMMTNFYLKRLLDNFFACTTRQIEFSNFEYEANKMVNNMQPFATDTIKNLYLQMLKKYENLSDSKINEFKKAPYKYYLSTILRIPHFYAGNFYVYKYAIGQICGLIVSYKIYNGDKNMLNKFIKFLSSGSSLSPLKTIELLGIDLNSKKPYDDVKTIIKQLITKFK
ncbi:MAG: oligoendopeptidase F [Mycoplasma sp.]|nr:oligoendopeptidase F [Mycoplasma sp.]